MNRHGIVLLLVSAIWVFGTVSITVEAATGAAEPNRPASPPTVAKLTREFLRQAMDQARANNSSMLQWCITQAIEKEREVPKDLLPDFKAFLKDPNPQVQLLGVRGLYAIKDPNSLANLVAYIMDRDLVNWPQKISSQKGNLDTKRFRWEWEAALVGVVTLGEVGDRSVIPLLESLRPVKMLHFEWGPGAVEQALSKLGNEGIRSLCNLSLNADEEQIFQAEMAIRRIKDPNIIPTLVATVKDSKIAIRIRAAAVDAIGDMNNVDEVLPFLMATMRQAEYPPYVRSSAAEAAARSGKPEAEKAILELLDQPKCDIRADCLRGLASIDPNHYLPVELKIVLDKSAPLEERKTIAHFFDYDSPDRIKPHIELIRQGLKAVERNGTPSDTIRISMWKALNKVTGEKPTLELKDPRNALSAFNGEIGQRMLRENGQTSSAEIQRKVQEYVDTFVVKWQPEKASVKP